ncbi:MAG: hypothetical protein ACRCTS_03680 [Fusobacteriaceae bacterium]
MEKKRNFVVDTNVLLVEGIRMEDIFSISELLLDKEKIGKMVILDGVSGEIEGIKKGPKNGDSDCNNFNNKTYQARKIYAKIYEFASNDSRVKYEDFEKNGKTVDESLVEYCVDNDAILMTCDTRLNLRYRTRMEKDGKDPVLKALDSSEIKKLVSVHQALEKLTKENLCDFLKQIFGLNQKNKEEKRTDLIDFIAFSEEKRYYHVMDSIVDAYLGEELSEQKERIREKIRETKIGRINNNELKKALNALKGVSEINVGKLNIQEESLFEKNKDIINKFLQEKEIESFEELKKRELFKNEEQLIEGILRYYEIK